MITHRGPKLAREVLPAWANAWQAHNPNERARGVPTRVTTTPLARADDHGFPDALLERHPVGHQAHAEVPAERAVLDPNETRIEGVHRQIVSKSVTDSDAQQIEILFD